MAKGSELAKAYVQIVPSAKGIKGSISNALGGEASSAGKTAGKSIASKLVGAIAVAGIGKAIGSAVSSALKAGGELEQSIGGIETLFKGNADKVKKYAEQAYKTAGLSANDYMQQVTSFSASLLQSLGGDTEKAGDAANQAVIDMSDNANKMGTSLDMIQNAYQGFAKQNYTMLDNLKLGYGGTKTEMERLLKDATKLSGVEYDISNLNDVYSAIHVMQEELGITGTTAKEAEQTLQGSFASMKASATNLLGNLALGKNITPSLMELVSTTKTFLLGNLLPMVGNIVGQIPTILQTLAPMLLNEGTNMLINLSEGFKNEYPNMLKTFMTLINDVGKWLIDNAPTFIDKGFEILSNLIDGILNGIPVMIAELPKVLNTFAQLISDNYPLIIAKGWELLVKFVGGIISAIPTLIANIPAIIGALVNTLMAFNWIGIGVKVIQFLGDGISSMINWIVEKGGSLVTSIADEIGKLPGKMIDVGVKLVKGLWKGIKSVKNWILDKIGEFGDSIVSGIKDFFGIHSPSRVFDKEVGKMLPLGLAQGIENNLNPVRDAMNEMEDVAMGNISTDLDMASTFTSKNDNSYLIKIIQLLTILTGKEFDIKLIANNREVARYLKELGVVL